MGIVLTGFSDSPAILSAINRARAYRFLTKPWEADTVLSAVAQASDHVYHKRATRKLMELLVQRNTELETALDDLRATQQQLLHLERLGTMGRLATGIVHDLRNVMFGLMTLEEGLYIGEAPPEVRDLVRVGLAGVRNLVSTLDSLYAYARSGQLSIESRPVSVESVLADAITVMRMNLDFRRRAVSQFVEPGLPPIHGDGSKLIQVLVNLIRNAVEATGTGQEIRIEARAGDRGGVVFAVEDAGCGVPPELADRLFEPFVSGKGERGMGMGLYMARLVVEAHRGSLACRPRPGGGTRFEFHVGDEGPPGTVAH
jgi:signal transduction histidine kinase